MNESSREPNQRIETWLSRIDAPMRTAFLFAFLLGLFVHLFMFTNKLPNHDDIICLFYNDATVTSGRWFLAALIALSSNFSLPWANGLISIAALGVTAALLVKLFSIQKPLEIILCAFSLVAFPSVTNAFGFMFTADGYMLGFLMAVLAAYLTDTCRLGFLSATVLLMLSAATYQATLCLYVAVLAVRGLQLLILGELDDRTVLLRLARYIGPIMVGVGLYLVSSKLALAITGLEMESYVGLDEMGSFNLRSIPSLIAKAYLGFFEFAFKTSGIHLGLWLSIVHLVLGLNIVLFVILCARKHTRTKLQTILLVAVTILLPLLLNSAAFFGTSHIHAIMMFGIAMVYWLGIVLYELVLNLLPKSNAVRLAGWAVMLAVFLAASGWGVYANQCYLKLHLKYENSYALLNRVISRVEATDGYTSDTPVAFIGEIGEETYPPAKDGHLGSLGSDEGFGGPYEYSFIYDDRHIRDFTKWYIGVKFTPVEEELLAVLEQDARVKAMSSYPARESVQFMDGVLVVKMGAEAGQ